MAEVLFLSPDGDLLSSSTNPDVTLPTETDYDPDQGDWI